MSNRNLRGKLETLAGQLVLAGTILHGSASVLSRIPLERDLQLLQELSELGGRIGAVADRVLEKAETL